MSTTKALRFSVLAVVAALLFGNPTSGQPSSSPWPMFRHDVKHSGMSDSGGPIAPELQWTFVTGGRVDSSPAVGSDGNIYAGSEDNKIYALDSAAVAYLEL